MSTLSVPLPADMLKKIEDMVRQGFAANKADLVRRAIDKFLEAQAIQAVLDAEKEPSLRGDLDELAKKL